MKLRMIKMSAFWKLITNQSLYCVTGTRSEQVILMLQFTGHYLQCIVGYSLSGRVGVKRVGRDDKQQLSPPDHRDAVY